MKDAVHHLKHVQKKILQSARRDSATNGEAPLSKASMSTDAQLTYQNGNQRRSSDRLNVQRPTPRVTIH